MDFNPKEEEKLFRKVMANFVDKEIIPIAREIDEKAEFPKEVFEKVASLGCYGLRYPKEYGGAGASTTMFFIMCEELARGSMAIAALTAMQCLMGTNFIFKYGTEEHRKNLLVPVIKGEKVAGFALTEPEAGTDLGNISTIAVKEGNGYVINGAKTWITNAPIADCFTVLCLTEKEKGLKGANFFLVEKDNPGLFVSKKFDKLGTHGATISELILKDCRIPLENRLGEEGRGIGNLMKILAEIRGMTAALSLGLARAAYDESLKYVQQRTAFNRPIGKFQLMKQKIANMVTEIEASRFLVYYVGWLLDNGQRCDKEASIAKYFASETACRAADEATRIFGAYGYSMEYPVQRFYRDTRFLLFGGGTSEILQVLIADHVGLRKL